MPEAGLPPVPDSSQDPDFETFARLSRLAGNRSALAVAVVALALLAYGNTVLHDFAFDDLKTIRHNPLLNSDHFWRSFFSHDYFWMSGESTYRPVVTLSYGLDHALFGEWAGGYHAANCFWHALNVLLLFWIAAPWFPRPVWGAVAAGILAIHPAGAEAVNGISFREDLLATTFILLAWLALRRSLSGERIRPLALAGAAGAFLLACLSKESGLIFPGLAFLGMWRGLLGGTPGKPLPLRRSLVALNWLMPSAFVFLWIWGWWMANPGESPHAYLGGSRLAAVYNVPSVYAHHLVRLIWPAGYQADYAFNGRSDLTGAVVQWEMGLFIAGLCLVVYLLWRAPRIGFGLGWIVAGLLPVSNLVPLFNPLADRYLYLPLVGFAIAVAATGEAAWRRSAAWGEIGRLVTRRGLLLAGGAGAAALLFITTQRNLVWGSDERLWSETILRVPDSWRALYRLGDYYRAEAAAQELPEGWDARVRLLARAEQFLRRADEIYPHHPDIHTALGSVYLMEGRLDEAIKEYRVSLYLYPRNPSACINLCQAYAHTDPPNYDLAAYYLKMAEAFGLRVESAYRRKIFALRRQAHAALPGHKATSPTLQLLSPVAPEELLQAGP